MADVSIILPVYNAEKWLDECLQSVREQEFEGKLQLSVYNDGSCDTSAAIVERWRADLEAAGITMVISGHTEDSPKGVGHAKNQAVAQSNGTFLCFLDADDVMHKTRVSSQHKAAQINETTPASKCLQIIGCGFHREPAGSTERYTQWANRLTAEQLLTQCYTSHGPTVIMPTWFCHRDVFDAVGGFDEGGKGVPEDLIFFYRHLELGGGLSRVDGDLLMYRYHPEAATFSVQENTIWTIRMQAIQNQVLSKWPKFTIWNAGKQGRKFYRSLTPENRAKVEMFCDVDEKKIVKGFYIYEDSPDRPKPRVPIVHFQQARPPFVICVKLDLSGGEFEKNLASLNLREGIDYYHFN